jgi:hypothetical protein
MQLQDRDTGTRVAGGWLAIAAFLLAASLAFHGPIAVDMSARMEAISEGATRWVVVHWGAAAALSCFVIAGLLALTRGGRLAGSWQTISAWAVVTVGALWTLTTAVAEATAVTGAAVAGDAAMFEAWWSFAEGKANGFAVLALAVAVIAASEARMPRGATPAWASWTGALAGIAAFAGWVLGMWLSITPGSLVWVVSSLVMCLWLLWFGVALARSGARVHGRVAGEPEAVK